MRHSYLRIVLCTSLFLCALLVQVSHVQAQAPPSCRDPKLQPFAQNSIWNTPIGSGAHFVPANFKLPSYGYDPEENVIVMTPDAPLTTIQEMVSGGWDGSQQARCASMGHALRDTPQVPVPADFVTLNRLGGTQPNAAGAFLLPDGHSLIQNQPVTRCSSGGELLSKYPYSNDDIVTGDGIRGAQGGTGMSSLGGAIRISEIQSGGTINHALKIVLYGIENLYFDHGAGVGYRWPAYQHDSGADGACVDGSNAYCGSNQAFKIGALLALPSTVDINSLGLQAESSKMIARAMQDYGAYAVDNSAWSNVGIATEFGPAGVGKDKLAALGGFNSNDLNKIFSRLEIVDNNDASHVGGGGTPRVPGPPPICGTNPQPTNTPAPGTPVPTSTTTPGCAKKTQGDADCDGSIKLVDYAIWRQEYNGEVTTKRADFNTSGTVTLTDYEIWRRTFLGGGTGPTSTPVASTATPTTGGGGGGGSCLKGKNLKIMPLGDSVTAGDDRGGYRFKLYELLKGAGVNFDFVGPNQSGSVADNDNAGFGGYQAGQPNDTSHGDHMISKEVGNFVPSMNPDVILVMAGVNDMYGGWANTPWSIAEVSQNVVDLAKQVHQMAPNSRVVVASQGAWGPSDAYSPTSDRGQVNAGIKAGISALGNAYVYAESMQTDMTTDFTPTDVHPIPAGYDKMGEIWFKYLKPFMVDCTP